MRKFVSTTILAMLIVGVCFADELIIRIIDKSPPPPGKADGPYYIRGAHDPWGKNKDGTWKSQLQGELYKWDAKNQKWGAPVNAPALEFEEKDGLNTWYSKGEQPPGKYKYKIYLKVPPGAPLPTKITDQEFTIPEAP